MIFGREPNEIWDRLFGTIENCVQQPLIYRDISVRGSFQELVSRNAPAPKSDYAVAKQ
jgi:hypothetical protein